MKVLISVTRWFFGLIFCFASIGGLASGEFGFATLSFVLGLILLPPVSKAFFKRKDSNHNQRLQSSKASPKNPKSFKSKLSNLPFPDRTEVIVWHTNAIDKGLRNGDFNLANLSYAKLVESIRQQNITEKGKYDDHLNIIRKEYEEFRSSFNLQYPQEFLPPTERIRKSHSTQSTSLVDVISKTEGNSTTFTIDLDEEELLKQVEDGTLGKKSGSGKRSLEGVVGFCGTTEFSKNKDFCIVYRDGSFDNNKWKNGELALVKDEKVLFKKKIQRPHDCHVSNEGITICCDWLNSEELAGKFLIFDCKGEQLFEQKATANLGACSISENGKVALFETHHSDTGDGGKLFIVDIEAKKEIKRIERPTSFNNAIIDTDKKRIKLIDHREFSFEIDFEGHQINPEEYEEQIMTRGSVYDRLWFYSSKPDEIKFRESGYLTLLKAALADKDASYSYGQDKIYRMIGEYHEGNGDNEQAVENWEKAIEINPKVGIKRRLTALKKKG